MNYNDSIKEVEEIVNRLQNNEVPIDKLQETIKRAATLIKECRSTLLETNIEIQSLINEFEDDQISTKKNNNIIINIEEKQ